MSLLGYRDLYIREIFEFLNGQFPFGIDKKIETDFQQPDPNSLTPTLSPVPNFNFEECLQLGPYIQKKMHRALELATLTLVLQNRAFFTLTTFKNLAESANKNSELQAQIPVVSLISTQNELVFLTSKTPQIKSTSFLILSVFLAKLYQDLSKIETCVELEKTKIGPQFLGELEKGHLEDRKLIKLLNVYKNYFKNLPLEKGEPASDVYQEIHLAAKLDSEIHSLEKLLLANLSFERKGSLQNKSVHENPQLVAYFSAFQNTVESISTIVTKLQSIKETRVTNDSNFLKINTTEQVSHKFPEVQAVFIITNALISDCSRVHHLLKLQEQIDATAFLANKKYKKKNSESWQTLNTLFRETSTDPSIISKFIDIEDWIANFPFQSLALASAKILAHTIETGKKPKIPKGTRDTNPLQAIIKFKAIEKIRSVYYKHGAVEIDTPIFELKETLLGKYGEEGGKLIYDLEDQGGELLSLRYDLTVPFARVMGLNNFAKMKRFHIGKVYRRDQPNINKGRFREFYQCDFDIAGKTDPMLAEAEILKIACEILSGFELKFKIKISHRLLLEAIIECAQCEGNKFRAICSSIDKLDKETWATVERELQVEKGLTQIQTDLLKAIVLHKGSIPEILALAENSKLFGENPKAKKSLEEIKVLNQFVQIFGISQYIDLDLSLARGLDYYTGIIYEGVLTEGEYGLGSIAGGGRYDELIGMFSKDKIPAVGISIGIERLFLILEEKYKNDCRASQTEFLIASIGKKGTLEKKLELANKFWNANIKTEIIYELYPKPDKQLKHALEKKIPFIIWIGEDEVMNKSYKIKIMYKKEEIVVREEHLVDQANILSKLFADDLANGLVVYSEGL